MPEYMFSLTFIFPYKDIFFESVLIRVNMDQRKPMSWHTLRSVLKSKEKMRAFNIFL